ncbi:unnamed protein product [Ostreobium quekettii]|uniref:polyribonucleotide nucleotidyltransferase n=1 Tax=Ostreobium quekettii TaxID=121088 RepID=A0A8S1IU24_9CHLO|nr:unnamed protein product [Ostreobium quekettii]
MAIRFGSRVLKRAEGRFAGLRAWERLFAQQGIAEANTDQQVQGLLSRRLLSTQNLPLTLCTISTAGLGVFNHGGPAADCRWHSQAGHVSLHQRSSSTVAVRSGLEGGDDADASGQLGILRSEEVLVGAWKVELETGKLARLADGSCMGRMGDTCVLSTVVCERSPQQAPSDMVPLQVHYREKLSAVGEIPRNFTRREGNPKDREVLCMRLLDRAIRPLFPPGFCHEIQVTTLALSIDGENDTDMLSINTASAALTCSSIPWNGPVGAVRIAYTGGQPVVNPTASELKEAQMELVYAGTQDRTVMMECDASEVPEDVLADMLRLAHQEVQKLLELQSRLVSPNAETKRKIFLTAADAEAAERVASLAAPLIEDMFRRPGMRKAERSSARREAKRAVLQQLQEQGAMRRDNDRVPGSGCVSQADLDIAFAAAEARALRGMALTEGLRIDGRGIHDIRPLETEVEDQQPASGCPLLEALQTRDVFLLKSSKANPRNS